MKKHGLRRHRSAAVFVGLLVAAILPSVGVLPAAAADPVGVQLRVEGCNEPTLASYNPGANDFVCDDGDYTTGNLGSNWEELDLVPHRLTTTAGNSAPSGQTFTVTIAADNLRGGNTGYDAISVPVKTSGSCSISSTAENTFTDGTTQYIYREVTVTQAKNTVCRIDYTQRLGIGASKYPGSNLHSNIFDEDQGSIGNKEVPLPVKGIEPQSVSKNTSASRGTSTQWHVAKSANPTSLNFTDTCNTTGSEVSDTATLTVSWDKVSVDPNGDLTITTTVTAFNPSSRTINVSVADEIFLTGTPGAAGTGITGPSATSVPVGANATVTLVNAVQTVIPAANVPSGTTHVSNRVTATYIDVLTGVNVPGSLTTTNSNVAVQTGASSNASVAVSDTEWLFDSSVDTAAGGFDPTAGHATPTGMQFSAVQTSGPGSFSGYTAGTKTTGPVNWSASGLTDDGSAVFTKTIYVAKGTTPSGKLWDKVTMTGDGGAVLGTATAQVNISSSADRDLVIDKSMNLTFDTSKTFNFSVKKAGVEVATASITIPAGQTTGSTTVTGLDAGDYVVDEAATAPFGTQSQNVTIGASSCSETVTFSNQADPATARVKKATQPGGSTVWTMTLTGGGLNEAINVTANDANYANFTGLLEEDGATYTITETTQTAWDNTAVSGNFAGNSNRVTTSTTTNSCSFTLNLTTDSGGVLSCDFTNVERGTVGVLKTSSGNAPSGAESFEFQLRRNASTASNGTVLDTEFANAGNGGVLSFAEGGDANLVPGTYQICEYVAVGWNSTITSMTGAFVPGTGGNTEADNTYVCVPVTLAAGQDFVLNVDNTQPPGGMAKTIGFWKNHASCKRSSGRQGPILDQTMALAGYDPLIGDVTVDLCAEAVDLLSKMSIGASASTVGDGVKKASDPAFNLAAQLVAYRLNQAAGAGTCAMASTAAATAQTKLDELNFNGNTHGSISGTLATQLNNLEKKLDSYNNNTLCT